MLDSKIIQDLQKIRNRTKLGGYENNIVLFMATVTKLKKSAGQYILVKDVTVIKVISEDMGNKMCWKRNYITAII